MTNIYNRKMTDTMDKQFDFSTQIDEPTNNFRIVHIYNKSDTYHLTRQVLLDSSLTQDTYCFFYHILAKGSEEFNNLYGSFAHLIDRNDEADLYLNVDSIALQYLIKYIQTTKINGEQIYTEDWKIIDEIIDLSIMFGMPNLVTMLRALHPSDDQINNIINIIKYGIIVFFIYYKIYIKSDHDICACIDTFFVFVEQNKESIVDSCIKTNFYKYNGIANKLAILFIDTVVQQTIFQHTKQCQGILTLLYTLTENADCENYFVLADINVIKKKINEIFVLRENNSMEQTNI